MNTLHSSTDFANLLAIVNRSYAVDVERIHLHRDMIGWVYLAHSQSQTYVLKLYRTFDTGNALRSIGIIDYLGAHDYPVVTIVPTRAGQRHICVNTPQGACAAVLFNYVAGGEPDVETEIAAIGSQVGRLHALMENYPAPLIRRGKDFYLDRYLAILDDLRYDPARIRDLERYAAALWDSMQRLPAGFCHGDLHTGNMLQTGPQRYVLYDFDAASRTCPVIDVAVLCDASDFNRFDGAAYEHTLHMFERFYQGYRAYRQLNEAEIAGLFDFIAIRHYELIATITQCQGVADLSRAFLDEQYHWLMNWKDLCGRKAPARPCPSMQ